MAKRQLSNLPKFLYSFFTSFYFLSFVLISFVFGVSTYMASKPVTVQKPFVPTKNIQWGVVDDKGVYDDPKEISIQHIFVSWKKNDATEVTKKLEKSKAIGRIPLLTVEPWVDEEDVPVVYNKILEGKYDEYLIPICKATSEFDGKVMFRFAHEMDLFGTSRYPWSNPAANNFQLMFRRVIDLCKSISNNLVIVWSPGGQGEFMNYYPGDKYVDIIGFSVYSYEEYEIKTAKRNFTFLDLFDSKYDRVKSIKKPIMIAEMGVSGSPNYKKQWLDVALDRIKSNDYQRFLEYVVYLNAGDEKPWVPGIPAPDFSVDKSQFPQIIKS